MFKMLDEWAKKDKLCLRGALSYSAAKLAKIGVL